MLRLYGFSVAAALVGAALAAAPAYEMGEVIVDDPLAPHRDEERRAARARDAYAPPPPALLVAHGTGRARSLKGWGAKRA